MYVHAGRLLCHQNPPPPPPPAARSLALRFAASSRFLNKLCRFDLASFESCLLADFCRSLYAILCPLSISTRSGTIPKVSVTACCGWESPSKRHNAPGQGLQTSGNPRRLQSTRTRSGTVVPTRADLLARVLGAEVGVRLVREQDRLQELDLLRPGRVDQVVELLEAFEGGDDLEGVALAAGECFLRVRGQKRHEKGNRFGQTHSTRKPCRFDE